MYILGLNSAYHESAACLIRDGKIVALGEEERFNRVKHAKTAKTDNPDELPLAAIDYCLKKGGITLENVNHVGYSLDPEDRFRKNTAYQHSYTIPANDFGTPEGEKVFYEKNLLVEKKLRQLGFKGVFHYLNHHECHAASAFFVSPFEKSGVLVIDGIGEFAGTTIYSGHGNKMEKMLEINFPNSLGFLWEKMSKFLGFTAYDASKVMGLASYGNPQSYKGVFQKIIAVKSNGEYTINDDLVKFRNEDYGELEKLFELQKRAEPVREVNSDSQKYADIAAALQKVTEEIVVNLGRRIKDSGFSNLCFAGGVALNCLANGELVKAGYFDNVFIQPAANDAGTAIGAAYYLWNQVLGNPRSYVFDSPYLGPGFSDAEVQAALDKNSLSYTRHEDIARVASRLVASGKVVAWFQDNMEIGPRALGNRSIICDPRRKEIREELNYKVKHREPFRPLCPSVLEEHVSEWFGTTGKAADPAKYMITVYNALAEKQSIIPAVVHVDGTSRLQVVSKSSNPKFHALIKAFHGLTGVPVVLNTSFNVSEPIVCTPEQAIATFLKTKIDYLAIGNFLVTKHSESLPSHLHDLSLKQYFEKLR